MNLFRGDINRLSRQSGDDTSNALSPQLAKTITPRCKPLRLCYQKEIVLYAHFQKLAYFSVECSYAKFGYRGNMRQFLAKAQLIRPEVITNILRCSEWLVAKDQAVKRPSTRSCAMCGYPCSQEVCQCCHVIDSLNKKKPKLAFKHSLLLCFTHVQ